MCVPFISLIIASAKTGEREDNILASSFYPAFITTLLYVTVVSPIYLVDNLLSLLLMYLNEMRALGESKVLIFCFWC